MSAPAEVSARPDSGPVSSGPLRVRPPSPLPPRRRRAIGIVAIVVLVVGAVLVGQARGTDGSEVPGAAWRTLPVPRGASTDGFERTGPLGTVEGFGTWQTGSGSLQVANGRLRTEGGAATATVDAGSTDVLIHAQVVQWGGGSQLLLSAAPDGTAGLALIAVSTGSWQLAWERPGAEPQILQGFTAPTAEVSVQAYRRGDQVKVSFDEQAFDVEVPSASAAGTFVGVASAGPGNELDLFGYLPLDPG